MLYSRDELTEQAKLYCSMHNLELETILGFGLQGMVFATNRQSAIKIHAQMNAYIRERDVYLRLARYGVEELRGFIIPRLRSHDDKEFILEMTLVSPPFIVDFGGAYLDHYPEHSLASENRENWEEEKAEQFGEKWDTVKTLLHEFDRRFGVCIVDVNPGNIQFGS
jgi:hypothetical protein